MDTNELDRSTGAGPPHNVGIDPKRMRILFVDDEAEVLEGLRSVLRSQRKEWEMVFALGGPAGLAELEKAHFDVVVSDMRMPVVDGSRLLTRVKEVQPDTVRLVLSGQTDADTVLRTVFVAHQFVSKPCESDRLRALVKRSCDLQALISSAELRRLAGDVSMLPAAPKVFTELVRVLGDSRSTTADAAKVVEREPALCAKILQVVNSACFGLSRKVSSIEMATRYLGTVALRNLALAMELANRDLTKSPLSGSAFKKCQHNVVLGAFLARSFVKGDRQRADDAFMAAMLRDMGCHLQASTSLPPQPCPGGVPAHTALGAYLLGLWGLPHTIIEAVAFHERPTELEHDCLEVSDIVHLADCIAGELVPSPFEATPPVLAAEHLERLGISAQSVAELRSQAQEMSQQVAGVIA